MTGCCSRHKDPVHLLELRTVTGINGKPYRHLHTACGIELDHDAENKTTDPTQCSCSRCACNSQTIVGPEKRRILKNVDQRLGRPERIRRGRKYRTASEHG
jgi:hypothetical protein